MKNNKLEFETIKRNYKPKIIIGVLALLVLTSMITFVGTRAKYRSVQSIKLASGTVNYKSSDLHLVAIKVSEDGATYNPTSTLPEGDYTLNVEKSKCRIPTSTLTGEEAPVASGVTIEYTNGRINVLGLLEKNTKCYIYFDKAIGQTSETIISAIEKSSSYKTGTPVFTQVATGAEIVANNGIFVTDDPMYKTTDNPNPKSYYWRGAATTNHVIFDSKCWRIVRINGDKSIRLIYNGLVQSNNSCKGNVQNADSVVLQGTAYNGIASNSSYVGWSYTKGTQRPSTSKPQISGTRAPLRVQLEDTWYANNITAAAKEKIATGKFCNDRNTKDNEPWVQNGITAQYCSAYQRLIENTNKNPQLSCQNGDVYELKVGMITADEVQFAGASGKTNNTLYYLYNSQNYWTMSPALWNGGTTIAFQRAYVFYVHGDNGSLSYNGVQITDYGVRPVINLLPDVIFNSGSDGTSSNPYIVIE